MNMLANNHPSVFQTDHMFVSALEHQELLAVQVVAPPASAEAAADSLAHLPVPFTASMPLDDLALATWEDAEWQ